MTFSLPICRHTLEEAHQHVYADPPQRPAFRRCHQRHGATVLPDAFAFDMNTNTPHRRKTTAALLFWESSHSRAVEAAVHFMSVVHCFYDRAVQMTIADDACNAKHVQALPNASF